MPWRGLLISAALFVSSQVKAEDECYWLDAQGEALRCGLASCPADDAPRLIYADALDEQGDSLRAEFIRLQIEEQTSDVERARAIKVRLEQILLQVDVRSWVHPSLNDFIESDRSAYSIRQAWKRPTAGLFERGFLKKIQLTPAEFLKLERALQQSVVSRVELIASGHEPETQLPRVFSTEIAKQITELDVSVRPVALDTEANAYKVIGELRRAPSFPRLEAFSVTYRRSGFDDQNIVWHLGEAPILKGVRNLQRISLAERPEDQNNILNFLTANSMLTSLRTIELTNADLTTPWDQVLSSPYLENLIDVRISYRLNSSRETIPAAQLLRVVHSPRLKQLKNLIIENADVELNSEILQALFLQEKSPSLTRLSLGSENLDGLIEAIIKSDKKAHLQSLNLSGTITSEKLAREFVQSAFFKRLKFFGFKRGETNSKVLAIIVEGAKAVGMPFFL